MSRAAPSCGYETPGKAAYRESVWREIRLRARTSPRFCRAILMPSTEAVEIDVAEAAGVLRSNIISVDRNPAIAATITRRRPGLLGSWGMDVLDAPERAWRQGIAVDVCHLDLTCRMTPGLAKRINEAASYLPNGAIVIVNVAKGREGAVERDAITSWTGGMVQKVLDGGARFFYLEIDARATGHASPLLNFAIKRGRVIHRNAKAKTYAVDLSLLSAAQRESFGRGHGEFTAGLGIEFQRRHALAIGGTLRQITEARTYVGHRAPMLWCVYRKISNP